ncbi:MAG: hypothetical protein LIO49_07120 [Ruminococcus sp.]|nr:hypothetical protein [Ruminococcus sp.]
MIIPTYEVYKKQVREIFCKEYLGESLSSEEVDSYLSREDKYIKDMYNNDMKAVEKGTAPKNYLLEAGASGTAYGLDMMY